MHQPLQDYLENILNYDSDASGTHLFPSFWYFDSPGELEDNSGYVKQLNYFSNGNTREIQKAPCRLVQFRSILINGVDTNFKFKRASESYYLSAPSDDNKVRIKI
jgi:hypothetical protein